MTKNQESKQVVVNEIAERFQNAKSVVLVDYRGMNVEEVTELRRQSRAMGVEYKVLKNTLVERAISDLKLDPALADHLKGPTAFAFGPSDPVAPAKLLVEYIKKAKKMTIKAGYVDGKLISAAGVEALAELPPKEVLIAKILGSMNAPITGIVTVLGGTLRSLLYTLNAIKDTKQPEA